MLIVESECYDSGECLDLPCVLALIVYQNCALSSRVLCAGLLCGNGLDLPTMPVSRVIGLRRINPAEFGTSPVGEKCEPTVAPFEAATASIILPKSSCVNEAVIQSVGGVFT